MRPLNSSLAYSLPDNQFIQIIAESTSCADAMRKMGFTCVGGSSRNTIKRRIMELALDISHWDDKTKNAHAAVLTPHSEYFAKNTPHSGGHICERLLKYNLIPYKCALCGNVGEWLHKPLRLQVDHINGDHNDNRLENLRFLCPNCHSQTETFAGKNVKYD